MIWTESSLHRQTGLIDARSFRFHRAAKLHKVESKFTAAALAFSFCTSLQRSTGRIRRWPTSLQLAEPLRHPVFQSASQVSF